jgi:hypothetical protein
MHRIIYIPGLSDNGDLFMWVASKWQQQGLTPFVYQAKWHDGASFQSKLDGLLAVIDGFLKQGDTVSLIGCSAGGSMTLNAFAERKAAIRKIVIISGRLRSGNHNGFRSLTMRTKSSPAFAESVVRCESQQNLLSSDERKKILTTHALLGDELVPADTAVLEGAENIAIPVFGHVFGIFISLIFFPKQIINFLKAT